MKKILSLLAFIAFTATAQQDITANLPATMITAATTNSSIGQGLVGWNRDQIAVLQIAMVTTNVAHITTRSNVYVRLDTSANGTDWNTNAYVVSVSPSLTADLYNNSITRLTNSVGGKWLRVGTVENANTNRVWLARFTIETQ